MRQSTSKRTPHIAVRTCAGCGERGPRTTLRRFALRTDGRLEWRVQGGRGSYLHTSRTCEEGFVRRKKSVLGLRTKVAVDVREQLLATAAIR